MDRSKIKIIEFGKDDDRPGAPAVEAGGARGMKIVEFDDEPDRGPRRPSRPREVGRIRIVEFDDDPPARRAPPELDPSSGAPAPRTRVGAIKIKEFDEDGRERPGGTGRGGPRIRIVEFD